MGSGRRLFGRDGPAAACGRDPAASPAPPQRILCPRRLRHRGAQLAAPVAVRSPSDVYQPVGPVLCGLLFRDGLGLYHHRGERDPRRGGSADEHPLLAQLHQLAGRHGRACVRAGGQLGRGEYRRHSPPASGRVPRRQGGKTGAAHAPQHGDPVSDLSGAVRRHVPAVGIRHARV